MRSALITGVCGQDGAYLARHLIGAGYRVLGLVRATGKSDPWRLTRLGILDQIEICPVPLQDYQAVSTFLQQRRPQEIFHLASQSSVGRSFDNPLEGAQEEELATLHLLESIRRISPESRFFFASSAEVFAERTVRA